MSYVHTQISKLPLLCIAFLVLSAGSLARAQEQPLVYVRHAEQASYPPLAAVARIEGTVKLKLTITPDGNVRNVETLSNDVTPKTHPLLEQSSIALAKTWTFGCFNCAAGADYQHVVTFI